MPEDNKAAEPQNFLWETELLMHWLLDDDVYRQYKTVSEQGNRLTSLSSLANVLCILSSIPEVNQRISEFLMRIKEEFFIVDMRADELERINSVTSAAVKENIRLGGDELVNCCLSGTWGCIIFTKDVPKFRVLLGQHNAIGL